jgi:hypothetical protein
MRVPVPGAVAAIALVFTACAPAPQPQTAVAPDAGLNSLQTFRVVQGSNFLGDVQPGETHPAFVNSTTSRALGTEIAAQLERRGYTANAAAPDVLVEYGAAAKEDVDPTDWNYNYLWRAADWRGWGPGRNDATPAEYTNGAVVIDVVDARSGQLLWRGHAPVDPSGDELASIKRLDRTADAILDRLPGHPLAVGQPGGTSPAVALSPSRAESGSP